MNWRLHLLGGFILAVILVIFFGLKEQYFLLFLLVPIYSLLSDIDHRDSTITWASFTLAFILCIIGLIYSIIFLYFGIGLFALVFIAVLLFKHRGFTHSIIFGILVSIPVIYFSNDIIEGLIIFGVFWSHLLLDSIPFKLI